MATMATPRIKSRKLRGKAVHVVEFLGSGSKRCRKFFTTKKAAEDHLKAIGVELQSGGILTPEERRDFHAAKAILKGLASMAEAAQFFATHHQGLQPTVIEKAIEQCVDFKERTGKRKRYVSQLKINLTKFGKAHPGRIVNEISREEIETWLFRNDWKQSTRRALLIDLRTFFNFAKKRGWISIHPCTGIERIQVDDRPPKILSPDTAASLLKRCRDVEPKLVPFVAVQLFAGLRPSEARRLSSDDIRGDYIHVSALKSKTRQRRLIPINDTLKAWLGENPKLPVSNIERRWRRVRYECVGIGPRKKKIWKQVFEWSPDVLRHSFCSFALPIMGAAKTAEIAGHSEAVLFRHYRELTTPETAKAFWSILPK